MRKYITSIILGCTIFAACTQEESYRGNPETITVDAAGYFRGVYQEGAVVVYDTEYTLANIHPYFKDWEMLISGQDANNSGLIITDIDCPVYIVAPASPTPSGWRKVTDSSHEGEDQTMRYITSSSKHSIGIKDISKFLSRSEKLFLGSISTRLPNFLIGNDADFNSFLLFFS